MDISLLLSSLALTGSIYTYFVHDRKLKKQALMINDSAISKIKAEKLDAQKAKIRVNSNYDKPDTCVISIYNKGLSTARNIRVEFIPRDFPARFLNMDKFPYELLNIEDSTKITIKTYIETPSSIKIVMIWDDDWKNNNEYSQIIDLKK